MLTKNICRTQNAAYFSVKIVLRKVLIKINQQTFTYFLNEHVNVNWYRDYRAARWGVSYDLKTNTYIYDCWRPFCALIVLPIHHLSSDISTLPQQMLPVQMTDERVSA